MELVRSRTMIMRTMPFPMISSNPFCHKPLCFANTSFAVPTSLAQVKLDAPNTVRSLLIIMLNVVSETVEDSNVVTTEDQ